MQGPETKYFLLVEGKFQKVENGMVMETTVPTPLQFAPDGWRDISIQNVRNQKYFALDRSITIPLSFVEDGAQIIKHWNYKKALRSKLTLFILEQKLELTNTHYGFYYTYLFSGDVDFASYKRQGPKVTVNIMEAGIPKYIKSNENDKYEFPLKDDSIKIKMDGVKLISNTTYNIIQSFAAQSMFQKQLIPCIKNATEGYFFNVVFNNEIGDLINLANNTITGFNPATDTQNYFLISPADNFKVVVKIKGGIKGNTPTSSGNAGNEWKVETSGGQNVSIGFINTPFTSARTPFEMENTITLAKGERLFLYRTSTTFNNSGFWSYDDTTTFNFQVIDRAAPTFIKAKRPLSLYKSLINKVTEGNFEGESLTLQNYSNIVVTSGDGIRGFGDAVIKTSLAEFFQSFNVIIGLGLGEINGKVKLETKTFFIDHLDPIDVGEVAEFEDSYASEYLIKGLKIGYNSKLYEDVNGRQEFNNTSSFASSTTGISKDLSLISNYRADCYGIEYLRVNTQGKTTSDSDSDNDVFVIHIQPEPLFDPVEGEYYIVDRSLNQYAEGLLEKDTVYNLWLSPKQCLLRNKSFIASHYFKQDDDKLIFNTTDKNAKLKLTLPGGEVIEEKGDIEISQLAPKFFDPIFLAFKAKTELSVPQLLSIHPLRTIKFYYLGIEFKGLPVKTGFAPESSESQSFQLLSRPDNNLEELEYIFD